MESQQVTQKKAELLRRLKNILGSLNYMKILKTINFCNSRINKIQLLQQHQSSVIMIASLTKDQFQ